MDPPDWMSSDAAATYLGIAPRTLYRLVNEGHLPAYKIGRVIRLQRAEVDAYILAARIEPGSLRHLCPPQSATGDDDRDEPQPPATADDS